jgi:hypothetical protein
MLWKEKGMARLKLSPGDRNRRTLRPNPQVRRVAAGDRAQRPVHRGMDSDVAS